MNTRIIALVVLALASCKAPAPDYQAANLALVQRDSHAVLRMLADDSSPEGERLKATASLQLGDLDTAANHLDRAVTAGGGAAVFADYARLELIRGRLPAAAKWQSRAEQADGGAMMTLLTGGEIAMAQQQTARALDYFDRAAQRNPDNFAVLANRAKAIAALRKWDELAPLLTRLEQQAPGDAELADLRKRLAARN